MMNGSVLPRSSIIKYYIFIIVCSLTIRSCTVWEIKNFCGRWSGSALLGGTAVLWSIRFPLKSSLCISAELPSMQLWLRERVIWPGRIRSVRRKLLHPELLCIRGIIRIWTAALSGSRCGMEKDGGGSMRVYLVTIFRKAPCVCLQGWCSGKGAYSSMYRSDRQCPTENH